jgi:regulator of protease activity HflC (stomatin/prohibitin superfamily)
MADDGVKLSTDIEVTSSSPDDARLTKWWGTVTAYPHEYLIHFRRGQFNARNSGQGASCFKWPGDTVFVIPTSLKEIIFQANQLSVDNVDVRIRGMAIYRISDPLKIYTMLNFSNRQRAEEKLARMIGDLCRSIAKWLVANMGIEECLRKRKEDIAEALKKEISLVVSDQEKGWGVEIVTIDIQDVYIQDNEIFNAIQNIFKTSKLREAQINQLALKQDLDIQTLQQDTALASHRKAKELETARSDAEVAKEKIRLAQENDERQFARERSKSEQEEALRNYRQQQELDRERQNLLLAAEKERQQMVLDGERIQTRIEMERANNQLEVDYLRQKTEVENNMSAVGLEKAFIEKALPEIAQALAKSMENSRMTIFQGDGQEGGTPFKFILSELMTILRERLENFEKPEE